MSFEKKKKGQSKYNFKNMYIVEKQNSITSKKQKHIPPPQPHHHHSQEYLTISSLSPEVSLLPCNYLLIFA